MYIGIKDNKIHDICSDIKWKRDNSIKDEAYLDLKINVHNIMIGDTWDSQNNVNLEDSVHRTRILSDILKTNDQLKIEALELKINEMDIKIKDLEKKG